MLVVSLNETKLFNLYSTSIILLLAGVIDRDYRGNVGVILFNFGREPFKVNKGDRIAQLICEKIAYPSIEECDVNIILPISFYLLFLSSSKFCSSFNRGLMTQYVVKVDLDQLVNKFKTIRT